MNLRTAYESVPLLFAANIVFSVFASLVVAYLIGRSVLASGRLGPLLLGCGVIIWGAAAVVAIAGGKGNINALISTHNICAWLSGLCHLIGVTLTIRSSRALRNPGVWLAAGYAAALGAVALVMLAVRAGWTPTFFVEGQGGTLVRDVVLGSATAMFAIAALLLRTVNRG